VWSQHHVSAHMCAVVCACAVVAYGKPVSGSNRK
jgi:hypothetical protein